MTPPKKIVRLEQHYSDGSYEGFTVGDEYPLMQISPANEYAMYRDFYQKYHSLIEDIVAASKRK